MDGSDNTSLPFWARINSSAYQSGLTMYSWVEMQPSAIGQFTPMVAGRSGSFIASPAVEPNCQLIVDGAVVLLVRGYWDTLYEWVYYIVAGASVMSTCFTTSGSGSGSGEGVSDCPCLGVLCIELVASGVTVASCDKTTLVNGTFELTPTASCSWQSSHIDLSTCAYFTPIWSWVLAVADDGTPSVVFASAATGGSDLATYLGASGWNCGSSVTLNRVTPSIPPYTDSSGMFHWPATITLRPCGSGGPTITQNTKDIDQSGTNQFCDATTFAVNGTGFQLGNANNLALIDHGGNPISYTYVSNTTTQIVVSITTHPMAFGALMATVSNGTGASGSVEVANVVTCGAGGREIVGLGTASTGGSLLTTLTIPNVTVKAGLLIVNVGHAGVSGSTATVKFGGTSMAAQGGGSSIGASGVNLGVDEFWLVVAAGTHDIVVTTNVAVNIQVQILNLIGYLNNPDQGNNGSGLVSQPDSGNSAASALANEAALACFGMIVPGGTWTWAGTPTFTPGGQDITDTVLGVSVSLTEGRYISTAIGQQFDAKLTGVTPAGWTGFVQAWE